MANTVSNNKISNLISSQVPFFVRNDHPNFIKFLEAYYKYLEQNDKAVNRIKNVQNYHDIDLTEDVFAERMYKVFLKYIPDTSNVDKKLLLKNIKDFYRAKGTEKSVRFLMNILFEEFPNDFYYPKEDILRASDGKWYIKKTIRIKDVLVDLVANNDIGATRHFIGTKIKGNTSNALAIVEGVDRFYQNEILVDELVLSNIDGTFKDGETIFARFEDIETQRHITANVFGGQLGQVFIQSGGALYTAGSQIPLENVGNGIGGNVFISKVSTGIIKDIYVLFGGAGYQVNNPLIITSTDLTGSGANGSVATVGTNGLTHPNSYSIVSSTIELEANTQIGNSAYSNLSNTIINAQDEWIGNLMSYWTYSNTGPILTTLVNQSGSGYTSPPIITAIGNTTIVNLGIVGRLSIIDGGQNYQVGDVIEFTNPFGCFGTGLAANVTEIDLNGSITNIDFVEVPGHIIGGSGYTQENLPTANVVSLAGNGANIQVTAILGKGASFLPANSTIGSIERITVASQGAGYDYLNPPTLNLQSLGDGTAQANISIYPGAFTYPGRYLNDDGQISAYNFLQDRDYYQTFSYVVRSSQSIENYRQAVFDLTHPMGTKLFGEYDIVDNNSHYAPAVEALESSNTTYIAKTETYQKSMNTISIHYPSHGKSVGSNTYLEFDKANVENALYTIWFTNTNYFSVNSHSVSNTFNRSNNSGNVEVFSITSINT